MVWAGLRARRLQSALVLIAAALSTAPLTMALTFQLVGSGQFLEAFEHVRGPDLLVDVPAGSASSDQLQATALLPPVTAAAGPWPDVEVVLDRGRAGGPFDVVHVTGRADPGGPVDQVQLAAGRWPNGPSEIALSLPVGQQLGVQVGGRVTAAASPGRPSLLVTGVANDLASIPSGLQRAWVQPEAVGALVQAGASPSQQMAYRIRQSQAEGEVDRDFALISSRLPGDAHPILLESSHDQKDQYNRLTDALNTAVTPFSIFALLVAAVVFFNVITGARLAAYHEIGILRAVGFSPRRVAAIFLAMIVAPAVAGCLIGAISGMAAGLVAIGSNTEAVVSLPVLRAIEGGLLAMGLLIVVAVLACLVPSLKAGRIQPVRALAVATPPAPTAKLVSRLVKPGSVSPPAALGLHDALARPVRAVLTGLGIMVAVVTVLYAAQARTALATVDRDLRLEHGDVTVYRYAPYPDSELMRTMKSRPETASIVAVQSFPIQLQGVPQVATGFAMRGAGTSTGFAMVSGRWFDGPGEAVAGQGFMKLAHLRLGDSVQATVLAGRPVTARLRIVGTYLDLEGFGRVVRFDWTNLGGPAPLDPQTYYVHLRPRADPSQFAEHVQTSAAAIHASVSPPSTFLEVQQWVALALPVLLALIGLAGAFTTMFLNARERAIGIATLKAVGMTGRQVFTMVLVSASVLGLGGAIAGIPLGVLVLHTSAEFTARQYDVTYPAGWTPDPSLGLVLLLLLI
ncbi:MAG TPA: FtsX-like permease family protein, partial [Candidatus Angelobacter sp.]|nr:FtsX-like permease family protein [Candidatus Angelobacter sp.]